MSALSEAMGVNMPSLYATFGNKEALFGPIARTLHARAGRLPADRDEGADEPRRGRETVPRRDRPRDASRQSGRLHARARRACHRTGCGNDPRRVECASCTGRTMHAVAFRGRDGIGRLAGEIECRGVGAVRDDADLGDSPCRRPAERRGRSWRRSRRECLRRGPERRRGHRERWPRVVGSHLTRAAAAQVRVADRATRVQMLGGVVGHRSAVRRGTLGQGFARVPAASGKKDRDGHRDERERC